MPISVTGRPSNFLLRESRRPVHESRGFALPRGFTLIEILVVLVIVAAMAALLVFSYSDSPQRRLQREAADLVALLNAAAEEAVMRGIELGVVIDDDGYRFVAFDPQTKQWQEAVSGGLAAHNFPERYSIDFSLDGSVVDQQTIERIKFLSQRGGDERLRPSILILSSGEITPFKLTLHLAEDGEASGQAGSAISLHCDGLNPVTLDLTALVKDRS